MQWSTEATFEKFVLEWDVLRKCENPGIVNLVGGAVVSNAELWLVMEFIDGCDIQMVRRIRDCKRL